MNEISINLSCPYCEFSDVINPPLLTESPRDVEAMPYTRDIGRFDPKQRNQLLEVPEENWSKIGTDFLGWARYERFGILRTKHADQRIYYRVHSCPQCSYMYDVYANYSSQPLQEIWPHLFGQLPGQPGRIKPYLGQSWIIWASRKFSRLMRLPSIGVILMGFCLFGLSFFPWALPLAGNPMKSNSAALFPLLLLRGTATIGMIFSLWLFERYVRFFEKAQSEFGELLAVSRERGIIHWRNYILCRLVGVQRIDKLPRLTQIDMIVGVLTFLAISATWIYAKLGGWTLLIELLCLIFGVTIYLVIAKFVRKKIKPRFLRLLVLIIVKVILYGTGIWILLRGVSQIDMPIWEVINSLFEAGFWMAIFYVLGTSAWISIGSSVYILTGLSKIPMRLNPLTGFFNARPLRRIQNYSSTMLSVFFVTVVVLISLFVVFSPSLLQCTDIQILSRPNWLTNMTFIIAGTLLLSFALSSKRSGFVYLTIFYIGISLLTSSLYLRIGRTQLNGHIIIQGIFFSLILAYHFFLSERIIRKVLKTKKESMLEEIRAQIESIYKLIKTRDTATKIASVRDSDDSVHRSRRHELEELERLINLMKSVEKVSINSEFSGRIIKFIAPILSAVFAQYLSKALLEIITN